MTAPQQRLRQVRGAAGREGGKAGRTEGREGVRRGRCPGAAEAALVAPQRGAGAAAAQPGALVALPAGEGARPGAEPP